MKNVALLFFCATILLACQQDEEASSGLYYGDYSTGDSYNEIVENPFISTAEQSVSTFSVDVDGASYSNCRRFIMQENSMPPKDAIRTEEFINYFKMPYTYTESEHPISVNGEVSTCPWKTEN